MNDTWQLTNDSPLSIKITSAKYYATETLNDPNGPWLDLRPGLYEERGLDLHLDDEMSEMQRVDTASPTWRGVLIRPGDTLTACVPNLVDLRINYRRAGLWGLAERRSVWVRGGV
ncbi:hypothetical protein SAMN04488570_0237 [Nocardioides scoriae]|uniref:Uncharacterized protein n=1 Tax=Nocardioides scoriae TaxID=642780 RepID=A0A1H1LIU7_9ACTN|nr:hypothetical protein [Nocardioides scoriae]SDR74473.1 hypothetical protein SAMN04488570_0237 [Nocardioides scoriae]